jgi:hypothetical protein
MSDPRRNQLLAPRREGLICPKEEDPNRPSVFDRKIYLSDPFHKELAMLVALLTVPFEYLCALEKVVLLMDPYGLGASG